MSGASAHYFEPESSPPVDDSEDGECYMTDRRWSVSSAVTPSTGYRLSPGRTIEHEGEARGGV